MPSTVSSILGVVGLKPQGVVPWHAAPSEKGYGVYLVSLHEDASAAVSATIPCPVSQNAVEQLLDVRPELRLDGQRPNVATLSKRVSEFWLPDEPVLYIGLTRRPLRKRVGEYYRTPLGARKPHAGGWFLKLLANIDALYVHYAVCPDPAKAESEMLRAFCSSVSSDTKKLLLDPYHPFPFANLEWPPGTPKLHGIKGATEPRSRTPSGTLGKAVTPVANKPPGRGKPAEDIDAISDEIQQQLQIRGEDSVTAVEAAAWLHEKGLLTDSFHRRGKPLRDLLRQGRILGQRQEANARWFIDRRR